jgi:hypothetical protein
MTRAQRIVAVLYCLLVVYCCVWIPWHAIVPDVGDIPLNYHLLWSDPMFWAEQMSSSPDLVRIALRLLVATALGGAAFLITGRWK